VVGYLLDYGWSSPGSSPHRNHYVFGKTPKSICSALLDPSVQISSGQLDARGNPVMG